MITTLYSKHSLSSSGHKYSSENLRLISFSFNIVVFEPKNIISASSLVSKLVILRVAFVWRAAFSIKALRSLLWLRKSIWKFARFVTRLLSRTSLEFSMILSKKLNIIPSSLRVFYNIFCWTGGNSYFSSARVDTRRNMLLTSLMFTDWTSGEMGQSSVWYSFLR